MEPLPVRPTTLPQARKFTREFKADGARVFTEQERIVIEIPPMPRTYLTKDARIYFTFDMSFAIAEGFAASDDTANPTDSILNVFAKPLPMLDVCGPYGFFDQIEIYDYLGNTLIEKTERHDLLAAMLSDFGFDPEVDRLRPYISEQQTWQYDISAIPPGDWDYDGTVSGNPSFSNPSSEWMSASFGYPSVLTRVNGINLMDSNLASLSEPDSFLPPYNKDYELYISTPGKYNETISTPTWNFSIKLLNFLGDNSDKFVPLHNGFRIVLHTNKKDVPVKFSLPNGGLDFNVVSGRDRPEDNDPGSVTNISPAPFKIDVLKYNIQNVFLRADVLEIGHELDNQVEKVVHARMKNYIMLGKCETPTIIPGNYLSTTNIKMSMRHPPDVSPSQRDPVVFVQQAYSELGFRSSTNVSSCKLLYNDAAIIEYKNHLEIMNALGPDFDSTISPLAFTTTKPGDTNPGSNGTSGYMYPYFALPFKQSVARVKKLLPDHPFQWINPTSDASVPSLPIVNMAFFRCNTNSGKFLINFDLTLNGYSDKQIVGIDTTKAKLKIDLKRFVNDKTAYVTDVFTEYDAIVTIDPGKTTSVSF